jgi:hypothetical protein
VPEPGPVVSSGAMAADDALPSARDTLELYGREREIGELRSAFEQACSGRASTLLLVGEAGIGKTRLAQAFADEASGRGALAVWGRAWEAGGAPPFWPWIEALRSSLDRELLDRAALGVERLAVLGQLVPELAPAATTPAPLDPAAARFRLFEAVSAYLQASARSRPLVLVLDDLHAADLGSLSLLHFVSRGIRDARLVVIGTYRDVDARLSTAVHSALGRIAREGRYIALSRLSREAVERWVARVSPSPELVASLWERTEGNPLFILETLRLVREQGRGAAAPRLPELVREVIEARLGALSPPTRALLEAAAVFGRRAEIGLAAAVSGIELVRARDLSTEAVRANVLGQLGSDVVEFTHILLRDALYEGLPARRRAELHAAALGALGPGGTEPAETTLSEVVHHAFAAVPVVSEDEAVAWARRAAARAVETLAYDDAADWLERALAALPRDAEHELERFALLLAAAEAEVGAGRVGKARDNSRQAAAIARARRDPPRFAEAALSFGRIYTLASVPAELVALLEEALASLPNEDSALRARLLARLGSALQPARDPEHPMALARHAIAMAQRIGDSRAELEVLLAAGSALGYFAHPRERAELNRKLLEIADRGGDRVPGLRARVRLAMDCLEQSELAQAEAYVREYERLAGPADVPSLGWLANSLCAMIAVLRGRFAEAEDRLAAARALALRIEDANAPLTLALQRIGLLRAAGRDAELAEAAPAAIERVSASADLWYARAFAASTNAAAGRVGEARALLGVISGDLEAMRSRVSLTWVAEACVATGDAATADRIFEPLSLLADRNHAWGLPAMVCEGPITHALGRLAVLLARYDEALIHLSDAQRRAEAMQALPSRARIDLALAEALIRRDQPGDREKARRCLQSAVDTAEALGISALVERATELSRRIAGDRAPATPPHSGSDVPAVPSFAMRREGDVWTISGDGEFRLKDSRGLRILARLVDQPGREFHVTDLLAPEGESGYVADSGAVLDRTALARYRERLDDLREQQREAEAFMDAGRAERLGAEIDALAAELARAVGLGGRLRKAGSTSEKARVNVRQRLRDAIDKVAQHSPRLGQHLRWAVRTGTFCSYDPAGR